MSGLAIHQKSGVVRFDVRVQPRASRTEVVGLHGSALKIRVQAPPVEGAANEAVIALLAERLGVPRSQVRVVTGASGRSKVVEVAGTSIQAVERLAHST